MPENHLSRRNFLAATAAVTAALSVDGAEAAYKKKGEKLIKVKPRKVSPNEKLNCAAIGAGGKGNSDIAACEGENVVALCDADWDRAAESFQRFPNARKFKDYRVMLEEMPEIDAVTVSTPDHTHAPAAYMAMKMGKHVYVQKPLTHTVAEARLLRDTARECGVATQMGNQGHAEDGVRNLYEMVWSGAIGQVKEVHIWTSRPVWPQGIPQPLEPQVIPTTLDWNLWIGTAPMRPYNEGYCPFKWRGWQDFGAGALGDMACHIMDPAYFTLNLGDAPHFTVEVLKDEGTNSQTFPNSTVVKYSFPARGVMGPVDVYWYDGEFMPDRPEGVADDVELGDGANGSFFVGEKGVLSTGEYGGNSRIVSGENMADYKAPDPWMRRIEGGIHNDWLRACKGGLPACSNFEYSGPFTEMVNFGNLAVKFGEKLEWDNIKGVVKNVRNPQEIVSKEYRKGWELPV
ncbi:MAG: Gfo/Idh/MocA family oxidoreductase [Candidatus Omnitrophica bacterium]|nr:Gfo/Idh/MocA family oxidoreductase [Candidatus Omnitrophota bacterium]